MKQHNLTSNQISIADAVATGRTIKEVADYLNKTPRTVFNTLSKIYEQLSIPHNVSALAVWRVCTLHSIEIPEFIRKSGAVMMMIVFSYTLFQAEHQERTRRFSRRCRYDCEIVEYPDLEEE